VHKERPRGRTRPRLNYLAAAVLAAATLPAALAAPAALAQTSAHSSARGSLTKHALAHPLGADPSPAIPHAAAMRAAQVKARATDRAVVVSADTTQTSQISANPNGSFTDVSNVLPVRIRQHGRWVPISARLVRGPHDSWQPAATTVEVHISGGGSGPLAVLSSPTGKQLSLWFPDRLPAPAIHGATATYRSIRPGVDLQLTAGAYGSVTEQLVVYSRTAAVSSWLRELSLTYKAAGLHLKTDRFGNVLAADSAGAIFTVSAPVTSIPVPRQHRVFAHGGLAEAAGPPQADTTARARVTGQRIVLPASIRQLPTRITYPITISATVTADAIASPALAPHAQADVTASCVGVGTTCDPFHDPTEGYVEAQDVGGGSCDTVKNWDSSTVTELGIGYNAWDSCIGIYQTYYIFGMGSITSSAYILESSTLQIPVVYSAFEACDDPKEPVYLHSLGRGAAGEYAGPNTDGADVSNLGTSSVVYDTSPAENDESPACASQTAVFNVLSDIKTGQSEGAAFWNFGVSGNNATDGYGFMRLSDNPSLVTLFDEKPPAPAVDQSTPPMMLNPSTASTNYGCSTSDVVPWIGATTSNAISLAATFNTGISGENVMPNYSISWYNGSGTSSQSHSQPDNSQLPGDTEHSWSFASPVDGDEYFWSVSTSVDLNSADNPMNTGAAASCTFAYDATPPTTPVVTSDTFPPLGTSPGTTQTAPNGSGTFSFSATDPPPTGCSASKPIAAAGGTGISAADTCLASGIYEFEYSLNQPLSSTPTPLGSGGTANCTSQSGAVPASNPTGDPETDATANPSAATTGTSCAVTISQWGTNTLYVAALDQAGNVSQSYKYEFYVPFSQSAKTAPGDVNGDGIPDLLATDGSGNLLLYPGGADPGVAPQIASVAADSPPTLEGINSLTWDQLEIAHRGSWSGGAVDDLIVLDQTDQDLFLYKNSDTATGMFENGGNIDPITYPACSQGTDPDDPTGNCTGYPAEVPGWGAFNQILVPGDAWGGAPTGTSITEDTGKPSVLAVDQTTGSLWLFQGSGGAVQNPVQLGSTAWNDVTLLAPGDVNNQLTLWARINSGTDEGDIVSFSLKLSPNDIPTLDPSAPGTLVSPTSGTILDGTNGDAIQLAPSSYPLVASPGALSGGTCSSTNVMACPGLYAVTSGGELVFLGGQATTTPADALTGSSVDLDEVGTSLNQLS
jgi:hypothetical protein